MLDLFAASGRHDQIKSVIERRFAPFSDSLSARDTPTVGTPMPPELLRESRRDQNAVPGFQRAVTGSRQTGSRQLTG